MMMNTTAARRLLLFPDDPTDWRQADDGFYCYEMLSARTEVPLYVGCTGNVSQRLARHRARKAWWPLVDAIAVESFDTQRAARCCEAHRIVERKPLFNVVGNRH